MTDSRSGDVFYPPWGGCLKGEVVVPGDKSISHRVLLLAALADGSSLISGLSAGADVAATSSALESLGVTVSAPEGASERVEIRGGKLREPLGVIDVGNSGTSIRLLAGLLSGQPFNSVLTGDASVRRRPMGRVVEPLRLMGAQISGSGGAAGAPLSIRGGALRGIRYEVPVASAQVKGSLLFAGLFAEGETTVVEAAPTRTHTEELLAAFGADVSIAPGRVSGRASRPKPFEFRVPGDPSSAAFWVVGASILPGSDVLLPGLYLGPQRAGYIEVLKRMGAHIHVDASGSVRCQHSALRAATVSAEEIPGLVDEIPILAVAAACAQGVSRFEGAGELRYKESDRLTALEEVLGAMGAQIFTEGDDLTVVGGSALRPVEVSSSGDHRIAMAACVALMACEGEGGAISGWQCVETSYPEFSSHLKKLWQENP